MPTMWEALAGVVLITLAFANGIYWRRRYATEERMDDDDD